MIKIKQRQDKWRIILEDEEIEFNTRNEMEEVVKYILDLKDKFGRINKNE